MKICPNLSNPQVVEQWEELVENLDGSVKAAYQVWSLNRGNNIDKAPNGEPSILFNSLLTIFHGDKKKATRAKAYLYTKEFFSWFGDWTGEYETDKGEHPYVEHSVAVDSNGEPMVLWHGTKSQFDKFELDIDYKRGRHLYHDPNSIFLTDREDKAHKYGKYAMPLYANIRRPITVDTGNQNDENVAIKDESYDGCIFKRIDRESDIVNGKKLQTEQIIVKKPNQIKSINNNGSFSSIDNNIYNYIQIGGDDHFYKNASITDQLINHLKNIGIHVFGKADMAKYLAEKGKPDLVYALQAINNQKELDNIKAKAIKNGTFMKAPNGKPTNLNEQQWLQVRTKAFKDWFGDWENDPKNASKVVDENGEPLVVYHGSKSILNVFDTSKSKSRQYISQQIKPTNFFSSDKTVADFFAITENQRLASQISASIDKVLDAYAGENIDENILDDEIWTYAAHITGKSKEFVKNFWENKVPSEYKQNDEFGETRMKDPDINKYKYNVFLNMKNPIILDAKGERADRFIEANKEVLNNNDEVIINNINETVGQQATATDYLVRKANNIKSATDNNGMFSTENDDIRMAIEISSKGHRVTIQTNALNIKGNKFKHSLYRGQGYAPVIDAEGNLHLHTNYDSLSKLRTLSFDSTIEGAEQYGHRAALNPYIIEIDEDFLDTILPKGEYDRDKVNRGEPFRYDEEFNEVRLSFKDDLIIPKGKFNITQTNETLQIENFNDIMSNIEWLQSLEKRAEIEEYNGASEITGRVHQNDLKSISNALQNTLGTYKGYDVFTVLYDILALQNNTAGSPIGPSKQYKEFINKGLIETEYKNGYTYYRPSKDLIKHLTKKLGLSEMPKSPQQIFNQNNYASYSPSNDDLPFFKTPNGEVYGFVDKEGNIYLDEDVISPEHPIHEYTHLWDMAVRIKNPELWERGVQLMKQTSLWKTIEDNDNYGAKWKKENLSHEELEFRIASEVHARLVGKEGAQILEEIAKEKGNDNIINKLKQWLLDFWRSLKDTFSKISKDELNKISLKEFNAMTLRDFTEGTDVRSIIRLNYIPGYASFYIEQTETMSFAEEMYRSIEDARNEEYNYLEQVKGSYRANNNGNEMPDSQVNIAKQNYEKEQLQLVIDAHQSRIANKFKMINQNGVYRSTRHDESADVLECIINAMNPDTFNEYISKTQTKYKLIGYVSNQGSILNIIRQAFFDGDVRTLDKEMIRDYVRMMWNTDLIQTGLDMMQNSSRTLTSAQLEEKLISEIQKEPLEQRIENKSIRDYVKEFWIKLNEILKKIFGSHNYTEQQKKDVIRAIQHAQMWNDQLQKNSNLQPIYERAELTQEESIPSTKADITLQDYIKQGTKTRLKAARAKANRNEHLINSLLAEIENEEKLSGENIKETYQLVKKTLDNAEKEFAKTLVWLNKLKHKEELTWDANQLDAVQRDFLGFYEGILNQIQDMFPNQSETGLSLYTKMMLERHNGDQQYDIKLRTNDVIKQLVEVKNVFRQKLKDYALAYLNDYIDKTQTQLKDKTLYKARVKQYLDQQEDWANLGITEVFIGMASRSNSPIIQLVDSIMSDTEKEIDRQVLQVGQNILHEYNKVRPFGSQVSPTNYQKRFMALDKDGIPTGYILSDLNRGQFYLDRDKFISNLNDKYANKDIYGDAAITIEDGVVYFHDEDEKKDDSVYNKYNDELDEWLDKHCYRKYVKEYYIKRRRYLSRDAIQLQNQIQRDISVLTHKGIVTKNINGQDINYFDQSKLTVEERKRLDVLKIRKRDLACPYIITTTEDGLMHVEAKTGDALRIAEEISSWNNFIGQHVKYKSNMKLFNAIKDEVLGKDVEKRLSELQRLSIVPIDKDGKQVDLSPQRKAEVEKASKDYKELKKKYDDFMRDNTTTQITKEFWDLLSKSVTKIHDKELEDLQWRRRELTRRLKEGSGLIQPNILKHAGIAIDQDYTLYKEIQRLDQKIADIKAKYRNLHEDEDDKDNPAIEKPTSGVSFQEIADMLDCVVSDENPVQFFGYLAAQWQNKYGTDQDAQEFFDSLFTYKIQTKQGEKLVPLSIFSYLMPDYDNNYLVHYYDKDGKRRSIVAVRQIPKGKYQTLDMTSDFVTKTGFNRDDPHSLQPKQELYHDSRFDNLTSEEHKLLDLLKSTMDEANSMIPQRSLYRDGLLPQITGHRMSLIGRNLTSKSNLFATLGYAVQDTFGYKYSETDGEATTNMDIPRRPDGTYVNNIPIRYVRRIEDRRLLTTDVIGSIIEFYNMAYNFKHKSENLSKLEIIQQALQTCAEASRIKPAPRQAQKVSNMLSQRYYGKTTVLTGDNDQQTKSNQRVIQTAKTFKKLASYAMLAANFTTIQVGYFDAMLSSFCDAIGGKYMTGADFRWGFFNAIKHLIKIVPNIGNPIVNDKLAAAMQYNQLTKNNSNLFDRTDQSKLARFTHEFFMMGGYTLSDYMVNASVLLSFYHSCRLITLPNGKQEFLNKNEAVNTLMKNGYTQKEATSVWKKSKITLWDAYEVQNGLFKVKDQYKGIVTTRTKNLMAKKLEDRTAAYNGVMPVSERAKLQQNVIGSYITLMRGFIFNQYFEHFHTGNIYAKDGKEKTSAFSEYYRDDLGYENLRTGEYQGAVFKDFINVLARPARNLAAKYNLCEKGHGLTENQKYAMRRSIAELAIIAGLIFLSAFGMVGWVFGGDGDDDKDPVWTLNLIDPEGKDDCNFLDINTHNVNESFKNWIRWKLLTLTIKLINERTTTWWPGTITDIVKSPTTATSFLDDLGTMFDFTTDIFRGNLREPIRSGGYKSMSKGTKDILKFLSFFPGVAMLDNIIRDCHVSGLKSTFNYYKSQSIIPYFIPSMKQWKKDNKENEDLDAISFDEESSSGNDVNFDDSVNFD